MRMIVLIILICIYSQAKGQIDTSQEIYILDPTPPVYSGGDDSLFCFLEQNLNYDRLNSSGLLGKVIVTFDLDTIGKLINIKVNPEKFSKYEMHKRLVKDSIVEYEINRVFKLMPAWKPGFQNGHKFVTSMTVQINIPYTDFKCHRITFDESINWDVDTLADFKGFDGNSRIERIKNFINSKLVWPNSANDCIGYVFVKCIVECDGKLSNFKIIRSLCTEYDQEAIRVVKLMPNWTPAIKEGRPVRSIIVIPIRF
jgi:hypothetical protein